MAKITSTGALSGIVGTVSFRTVNGTAIVQAKPGRNRVKQTQATKKTAFEFGHANMISKKIRNALFPILQHHHDARLYNRFATKVHECAIANTELPKGTRTLRDGDLSLLSHFPLNTATPMADYCAVVPEVLMEDTGVLTIATPAFAPKSVIAAPDDATHAALVFLVTAFETEGFSEVQAEMFTVDIPLYGPGVDAQEFASTPLPEDSVVFVTAALFYYRQHPLTGLVGLNSKALHPSEVVLVMRR